MTSTHLRSAPRNLRLLLDHLDELGATLDGGLRAELDAARATADALIDWATPSGGVVSAAFDAIVGGKDPLTDKRVQAAVVAETLNHRQGEVRVLGLARLAELTTAYLDEITAAVDEAYQTHVVQPMTSAIAVLAEHGVTDPETPAAEVLRGGGRPADAWLEVSKAKRLHDELVGELQSLIVGLGLTAGKALLMYADPNDTLTLQEVRALGSNPHPWVALNAGMTLSIATRSEQDERQQRAAAVATARQQDSESAERRAVRTRFGTSAA